MFRLDAGENKYLLYVGVSHRSGGSGLRGSGNESSDCTWGSGSKSGQLSFERSSHGNNNSIEDMRVTLEPDIYKNSMRPE